MPAGSFVDSFNQTPNAFTNAPSNVTLVTVLLQGILSNQGKVWTRVTFQSQNITNGLTIDGAYIQTQGAGDAYDFSATPVQLLFNGGNTGFSIGINSTITSDAVKFTIPAATNICIAIHTSGASSSGIGGKSGLATGNREYFRSGISDAATVNKTGYTASTDGTVWPIARIEVADDSLNFQTAMIIDPTFVLN